MRLLILACVEILLALAVALTPIVDTFAARLEIDLASTPIPFTILGNAIWDRTGTRVASCDANGDGVQDLLIASDQADGATGTRYDSGEAWLLLGRRGRWQGTVGISQVAATRILGPDLFDNLGRAVACADLNGDGFDDLVIGAVNADGLLNNASATGEAHIVFGRANWPTTIDLLTGGSTVLYGETRDDLMGYRVSTGDLNADGTADVVIGARNAEDASGQGVPGRAYLLFGRGVWPGNLSMMSQADVTFFGQGTLPDWFGTGQAIGDLDQDQTVDLVVGAFSGDGPADSRQNAGDIHLFRGRSTWPTQIDLSTTAADSYIYGADSEDHFGILLGLVIADPDRDGRASLFIGSSDANGPSESRFAAGEFRAVTPGPTWPQSIDLATSYSAIGYAATAGDQANLWLVGGDANRDDFTDIAIAARDADGPGESRSRCGETLVLYGSPTFPSYFDFATGHGDIIIYGKAAGEVSTLKALADLNDDGFDEILIGAWIDSTSVPSELRFISPFDSDGDGLQQLADNCPLVANPSQLDSDGDARGDSCQLDWDGDMLDDPDDCAPSDELGGAPPEAMNLRFATGTKTELSWNVTRFGQRYEVTRGDPLQMSSSDYGSCVTADDPDPTDLVFIDSSLPAPGSAFSYLISARNEICNLPGPLGSQTSGNQRVNTNPSACGD